MTLLFARNHNFLLKVCIANLTKTTGISSVRGLAEVANKTISPCAFGSSTRVFKKQLLLFPRCILQAESSIIHGLKLHRFFSTGSELNRQTPKIKSKNKDFKNLFDLVETDVKKDVLLFSCYKATSFYTFFSWFGLIFLGMSIGMAELAWALFGALPLETEEEKQQSWYNRFSLRNKILRYLFVLLLLLVGVMGVGLGFMVPTRTVREIFLMSGGKMGRIVTFGPFGRNVTIERPLSEITPLHSRTQHKSNLIIKITGYKGFFTCDTGRGIFHEKQLYDFTVGTKNTT